MGRRNRGRRSEGRRREKKRNVAAEINQLIDSNVPTPIKARFVKLGRKFDPAEEMASRYITKEGQQSASGIELLQLLQIDGIIDEESMAEVVNIGLHLDSIMKSSFRSIEARGLARLWSPQEIEAASYRSAHAVDRAMNDTTRRLWREQRGLLALHMQEVTKITSRDAYCRLARKQGVSRFIHNLDQSLRHDPRMSSDQLTIDVLNTFQMLQLFDSHAPEAEVDLEPSEAFELLRDEDFFQTVEGGARIQGEHTTIEGRPIKMTVFVLDPSDPFAIATVRIDHPRTGLILGGFNISRINGELIFRNTMNTQNRPILDEFGHPGLYEQLKKDAYGAVIRLVDSGQLESRAFVTPPEAVERPSVLEPTDVIQPRPIAQQPAVTPTESVVPVVPEETHPPEQEQVESQPVDIELPALPSIEEQMAAINAHVGVKKEKRVVKRTSRLTWNRIMRSLKRLGVQVEYERHSKLRLGKKKTDYLNSHGSEDPQHNWSELKRVLRDLEIAEDDFWANLK